MRKLFAVHANSLANLRIATHCDKLLSSKVQIESLFNTIHKVVDLGLVVSFLLQLLLLLFSCCRNVGDDSKE